MYCCERSVLDRPHLEEDLSELRPDLHERMQVTAFWSNAHRFKVIRLKLLFLPAPTEKKHSEKRKKSRNKKV